MNGALLALIVLPVVIILISFIVYRISGRIGSRDDHKDVNVEGDNESL